MTRKTIRQGIAIYFGGSTLANGWYQPTPLAANGLAGVRAYYNDQVQDHEYFADVSTRTGAVMCVHLEDDTEKREAIGGLGGGILDVPFNVALYLFLLTLTPSQEDAQADRDDLVQAVRDRLRADPTMGGLVLQAGEGEQGISTSTPLPYFEPPARTMQTAVIGFTANTYPAG